MKIVINQCYSGFGLSGAGIKAYADRKGIPCYPEAGPDGFTTYWTVPKDQRITDTVRWEEMPTPERIAHNKARKAQTLTDIDIPRNDPALVAVVEELGQAASNFWAKLEIVEIPDDVEWQIEEYDGLEHVAEKHRTWPEQN